MQAESGRSGVEYHAVSGRESIAQIFSDTTYYSYTAAIVATWAPSTQLCFDTTSAKFAGDFNV